MGHHIERRFKHTRCKKAKKRYKKGLVKLQKRERSAKHHVHITRVVLVRSNERESKERAAKARVRERKMKAVIAERKRKAKAKEIYRKKREKENKEKVQAREKVSKESRVKLLKEHAHKLMLHRELKVKEQKVKAKATERRVKERRAKAKAREHVGKEAKAKASYRIVTTTITHYQFHSIKGPGAHEKKRKIHVKLKKAKHL